MPEQRGHKWFAAVWGWMVDHEPQAGRQVRQEIAGGAKGRVLEIGCGTGGNFPYYSDEAIEVIATEPDPYMLERARKRAVALGRAIQIQQAPVEELPFEDGSFDAVVCTSVLLMPQGELRFFEHVRYDHAFGAFWQDLISPLWRWWGAGCRPNQETARLIREAGFLIQELDGLKPTPPPDPTRPCIKGVALRG